MGYKRLREEQENAGVLGSGITNPGRMIESWKPGEAPPQYAPQGQQGILGTGIVYVPDKPKIAPTLPALGEPPIPAFSSQATRNSNRSAGRTSRSVRTSSTAKAAGIPALSPDNTEMIPFGGMGGMTPLDYAINASEREYQRAPGNFARNDIGRLSGLIDEIMSEMRTTGDPTFKRGYDRKAAAESYRALAGLLGQITGAYGQLAGQTAGLPMVQHQGLMKNAQEMFQQGIMDKYYTGQNLNAEELNRIKKMELLEATIPLARAQAGHYKTLSSTARRGEDPYKWQKEILGKGFLESLKTDDPQSYMDTLFAQFPELQKSLVNWPYYKGTQAIKGGIGRHDIPAQPGYHLPPNYWKDKEAYVKQLQKWAGNHPNAPTLIADQLQKHRFMY